MMGNRVYRAFSVLFIVVAMSLVFGTRFFGASSSSFSSMSTAVGGPITSDTNWTEANSPYIVTSSVLVSEGVTLTIEPGVVVKFELARGLQVDGQLIARGTGDKQIVFTSIRDDSVGGDSNGDGDLTSPAPGDWAYIFFTNASIDATFDADESYLSGSILEYCSIKYGGSSGTQGAIRIDLSAPFLNYTIVNKSANDGIYISQGTPKIANSSISDNSQTGIYVDNYPGGSEVTVVDNTIINNLLGGIYAYVNSGTGIISNNTITNNSETGVHVVGAGAPFFTIKGNIVRSNSYIGIYVYGSNGVITNNVVTNNGAGISVTGLNQIITNNIIAYNQDYAGGGVLHLSSEFWILEVSDNSIIANTAPSGSVINIYSDTDSSGTFRHNLLTQNTGNSTVSNSINVAGLPIVNYNNFFNNFYSYELQNTNGAGSSHVDAKNNWWGTSNETEIQAKIYDWFDDATKGIVDYQPYDTSIRTDVPISPPTNFTLKTSGTSLILSWNPNPEPDLAGYKIYYDADTGYPYTHSIDVGNVNTHTLDIPPNAVFFTVAAYDTEADGNNDLFEGHESWYAYEAIVDSVPPIIRVPSREPAGDVQSYQSVKVSVNVTDTQSQVKNVTLFYTLNNGTTWEQPIPMTYNVLTNLYNATIPQGMMAGTWVRYKIVAYDYAGNNATKEGFEPYFTYQVIPEFPSTIIMPLFMITTILIVIIRRRKHPPQQTKRMD